MESVLNKVVSAIQAGMAQTALKSFVTTIAMDMVSAIQLAENVFVSVDISLLIVRNIFARIIALITGFVMILSVNVTRDGVGLIVV